MERGYEELINEWQEETLSPLAVEIDDETLRDGRQSSYIKQPNLSERQQLLHLMDKLGIHHADIGFPQNSDKELEAVTSLAKYKADNNLRISLSCAGRTCEEDVVAISRAQETSGVHFEADLFIGSSEIRKVIHEWNLADMRKKVAQSISLAVKNNLSVMFVTEDTTRAHQATLLDLYQVAIDSGAERICIADTVGKATPPCSEASPNKNNPKIILIKP